MIFTTDWSKVHRSCGELTSYFIGNVFSLAISSSITQFWSRIILSFCKNIWTYSLYQYLALLLLWSPSIKKQSLDLKRSYISDWIEAKKIATDCSLNKILAVFGQSYWMIKFMENISAHHLDARIALMYQPMIDLFLDGMFNLNF